MLSKKIKKDFPIFGRKVRGKDLVYLDNAATSQCPQQVIDVLTDYYSNHRANIHRGIHTLSEESTQMYEEARKTVADFIGAKDNEVAFVKNTTEGSNLVSFSFLPNLLKKGDTIVVSEAEHHSNLIPWQQAAKSLKLNIEVLPLNSDYTINLDDLKNIDYKFIAINHVSNFLGNINPIKQIVDISNKKGAKVFVDGAQGIPHIKTSMKSLGCDFYAFSGHKIYAPFGTGALFIKEELLEKSTPFMTGGGMIKEVSTTEASYLENAEKYDAGTPNVGGNIAFAGALKYFTKVNDSVTKGSSIMDHEEETLTHMLDKLLNKDDIEIYGPKKISERAGLVSFNVKGIHSHDLASILDSEGIAVRSGHHCTMPAHKKLNIPASTRASIAMYNTKKDVDALLVGIEKARRILN